MGWFVIAFGFAGLWLWAMYQQDRCEPEPPEMIACALGWGVLAFFGGAFWFEGHLLPCSFGTDAPLLVRIVGCLLVIGPIEELCKFAGVRLRLRRQAAFNEPMDGIFYGAAVAIGFALAENLYLMADQPAMILARGPGGTLAHILFAGLWAAPLGWAKADGRPWRQQGMLLLGLLGGSVTHGLFDLLWACAGQELPAWGSRLSMLLLLAGGYGLLRRQMKRAGAASPSVRRPRHVRRS